RGAGIDRRFEPCPEAEVSAPARVSVVAANSLVGEVVATVAVPVAGDEARGGTREPGSVTPVRPRPEAGSRRAVHPPTGCGGPTSSPVEDVVAPVPVEVAQGEAVGQGLEREPATGAGAPAQPAPGQDGGLDPEAVAVGACTRGHPIIEYVAGYVAGYRSPQLRLTAASDPDRVDRRLVDRESHVLLSGGLAPVVDVEPERLDADVGLVRAAELDA